jgi:hypothetical protein
MAALRPTLIVLQDVGMRGRVAKGVGLSGHFHELSEQTEVVLSLQGRDLNRGQAVVAAVPEGICANSMRDVAHGVTPVRAHLARCTSPKCPCPISLMSS